MKNKCITKIILKNFCMSYESISDQEECEYFLGEEDSYMDFRHLRGSTCTCSQAIEKRRTDD